MDAVGETWAIDGRHLAEAARLLGNGGGGVGRSARENVKEILSYVVSFGLFYLFIWAAKRAYSSQGFRRDADLLSRLVDSCVGEPPDDEYRKQQQKQQGKQAESSAGQAAPETMKQTAMKLAVCTIGIQVSYLLWGLMQERIMTKPYTTGDLFIHSKFLVFANRFLALLAAWLATTFVTKERNPARGTPLYKFSFSSASNIVSSVCQMEALKYVSFPTQVLAKSCKMVPVMLMGYVVSQKRYVLFEYVIATAITAGAMIFKLFEANDAPVKNSSAVGILLILSYMVADSFTSNWQDKVFRQYQVSSTAMMMYANLFSAGFTGLGLVLASELGPVLAYTSANPGIVPHMLIMAICSAVGQLFIFYTIKQFGPLAFATIQTVRQFLSVVLSILFFHHPINQMEAVGILIVFAALGAQIWHKFQARKAADHTGFKPVKLKPDKTSDPGTDGDTDGASSAAEASVADGSTTAQTEIEGTALLKKAEAV